MSAMRSAKRKATLLRTDETIQNRYLLDEHWRALRQSHASPGHASLAKQVEGLSLDQRMAFKKSSRLEFIQRHVARLRHMHRVEFHGRADIQHRRAGMQREQRVELLRCDVRHKIQRAGGPRRMEARQRNAHLLQRLVDIGQDIGDILSSHGQPNVIRLDAGFGLFGRRKLLVRG